MKGQIYPINNINSVFISTRQTKNYDVRYMVDEYKARIGIGKVKNKNEESSNPLISLREDQQIRKSIYNSPRFNLLKDELLSQMTDFVPKAQENTRNTKEDNILNMTSFSYNDIIPMSKLLHSPRFQIAMKYSTNRNEITSPKNYFKIKSKVESYKKYINNK